jgi:hypothetical protein
MNLTPLPDAGVGDSYDVTLTVYKGAVGGNTADLNTEILTAWAEDATGAKVADATVTPSATPGQAQLSWAKGALPRGTLWLRAVLTIGGEAKTVWRRSLRVW